MRTITLRPCASQWQVVTLGNSAGLLLSDTRDDLLELALAVVRRTGSSLVILNADGTVESTSFMQDGALKVS